MIKKILIANRGEIAARIIRTCKKLQIKTVAIYSEADKEANYVKLADESYLLGPSRVNESYLNIEKILEIAEANQVDAIHPGYGFMSENSLFAAQCADRGITFIGPKAETLDQMGDKITARKIMQEMDVPVIPGTDTALEDVESALEAANEFGYPIMLKAASGGGGIGMQVVHDADELIKAFESNQKRASNFFGNGAMFLEKLLTNVRHIEIQVLCDTFGNAIHLFDRECSIQRRNQKVIEEAPSSFLSEETRQKMGQTSVQIAEEIGYINAGTIEFLVDEAENYYFLEMNTRIQVEHAITEEITGIDIVAQQIAIANGDKLTLKQADIEKTGYAIEARIYAEDPVNFFPSPGQITSYSEPTGSHVRIESSVSENTLVTPFYDPMIAKLIIKASSRKEAVLRLKEALLNYNIAGIKTNIPMLLEVVENDQYKAGITYTNFVEKFII